MKPPSMQLLDAHAHLCDPIFDKDRLDVLERARAAGIDGIVTVGENMSDAQRNLELAVNCPMLKPAAGLYPARPDFDQADEMRTFIRREQKSLVAIGEVGLDYWVVKSESEKEIQRLIFKDFIDLAKELNLPLNIHSRSAGRHAVSLLLENGACRVQMHAFDGKAGAALPGVDGGYFFSIPPSVIRSRQKQKLVKQLPLSCLLVETDSPVLGPSPQDRNEPANLMISIKTIAEIKDISEDEVREAVTENTWRLYGDLR